MSGRELTIRTAQAAAERVGPQPALCQQDSGKNTERRGESEGDDAAIVWPKLAIDSESRNRPRHTKNLCRLRLILTPPPSQNIGLGYTFIQL